MDIYRPKKGGCDESGASRREDILAAIGPKRAGKKDAAVSLHSQGASAPDRPQWSSAADEASWSEEFLSASGSDGFHSVQDDLSPSELSDDEEVTSHPAPMDSTQKWQRNTFSSESFVVKNNISAPLSRLQAEHPDAESLTDRLKGLNVGSGNGQDGSNQIHVVPKTKATSADQTTADWDLGNGFVMRGAVVGGLYPHQREGIKWLWKLHQEGRGGILGDDMGLGKTRQIASFLAGLLGAKIIKRALLVIPATLLSQWHLEFRSVGISSCKEFSSRISIMKRDAFLYDYSAVGGILLTTYEMVKQVKGHASFDYLVLDEGHLAKNRKTQRFQVLKTLSYGHCIILTGTPLPNKLKELWALFDLCCGGLLGTREEFKSTYESTIVSGNEKDAPREWKVVANEVAKALRAKIKPYLLRRTKREIFPSTRDQLNRPRVHSPGQLPPLPLKTDLVVWLTLTNRQRSIYEAFMKSPVVRTALNESWCFLAALTVLRKICDHPKLLTEIAIDDMKEGLESEAAQAMNGEALEKALEEVLKFCKKFQEDPRVLEDPKASCKLRFLGTLLVNLVNEGHHVLVFSQMKIMLNMAEKVLKELGIPYLRIDGVVRLDRRERCIQQFQAGVAPVFLLTTKVGGVGLTLHRADRVVILDPWWNLSVDNQSVDRAYRIGQLRDIVVYRLISCATIEEKIYGLQVMKEGLFKSATVNQNNPLRYFNVPEVKEGLRMPEQGFHKCLALARLEGMHKEEIVLDPETKKHIDQIKVWRNVIGVSHHDLLYNKEDDSFFADVVLDEPSQQEPLISPDCQAASRKPLGTANPEMNRPGGILAAAKSAMPYAAPAPTVYDINRAKEEWHAAQAQVTKLDEQINRRQLLSQSTNMSAERLEKIRLKVQELESERSKAVTHAATMRRKYEQISANLAAPTRVA